MANAFARYLEKSGVAFPQGIIPGGQTYAIMQGGRAVGGVFLRTWPHHPEEGDIHIIASMKRIKNYETVIAFADFLSHRADIMAIKRWKVLISASDTSVASALLAIGFKNLGRQALPIEGDFLIFTKEV